MHAIRGITVCVECDDLLNITLIRNMRHFTECFVVTTPEDQRTKDLCAGIPNVHVIETRTFYTGGAKFNKGLALETAFDVMGRSGWILIWDADTLFQSRMALQTCDLKRNMLYGCKRRILEDPRFWNEDFNWSHARPTSDRCGTGYFQLFHAESEIIKQTPQQPDWYDVTFTHAGGGDGYFTARWGNNTMWLPWQVLHLGPRDRNWMGRASQRLDGLKIDNAAQRANDMTHFLNNAPWRGKSPTEFSEHVVVEGHAPTGYKTGSGKVDPKK